MYSEETSQVIAVLMKYLKEEKTRSGLSGLVLENINMRLLSEIKQKKKKNVNKWQPGNNYSILFLCLISCFIY